jgi:hypothetical protein
MTTIDMGRSHTRDPLTSGENTLDENVNKEDETPEARIPEINIDHPMEKDACFLICNSGRKYSGEK